MRWQIGIDEAGRGALAGPVCVGAVIMPVDFDWREVFALITKRGDPRLRDSKQLSSQQRDILFEYIIAHGRLRHAAALVDAQIIDSIGIVNATREAAAIAIRELHAEPDSAEVLLDAGLAVAEHWNQESFIKGDERIPVISLASIIAKVTRDRYMEELSDVHGGYGFELHKGYGTLTHRMAIKKRGMVPSIHRRSFLGAYA